MNPFADTRPACLRFRARQDRAVSLPQPSFRLWMLFALPLAVLLILPAAAAHAQQPDGNASQSVNTTQPGSLETDAVNTEQSAAVNATQTEEPGPEDSQEPGAENATQSGAPAPKAAEQPAESPGRLSAQMLEAGVFESTWTGDSPGEGVCMPPALRLEESTDSVTATLLSRFGFTYLLSGGPAREHRLQIVVTHPPIEDPETSENATMQTMEVAACPGTPAFAGWTFTTSQELVPGTWSVELRQEGRMLLRRDFQVTRGLEYPQMQLGYSLSGDDNATDEFLLTRQQVWQVLTEAGLGVEETAGVFVDKAAAEERAGQCRRQGKGAEVLNAGGVGAGAFLVQCTDFTRLSGAAASAVNATGANGTLVDDASAGWGETESDVAAALAGAQSQAPESGQGPDMGGMPDVQDMAAARNAGAFDLPSDPSLDEVPALPEELRQPATKSPAVQDDKVSDSAAVDDAAVEGAAVDKAMDNATDTTGVVPAAKPVGGYGVLLALLSSGHAATRHAGAVQEKTGIQAEVHRFRLGKDWLFAVIGPPVTLAGAQEMLAGIDAPENPPFLIKLAPLQALARGGSAAAAAAAGYDPSLAAMSHDVDSLALDALQQSEQTLADVPTIDEVAKMPEGMFGPPDDEELDQPADGRGWRARGEGAPRPRMAPSQPVRMPEKTGVHVLAANTRRRSEAQEIADTLKAADLNAVVHRLDKGGYEVRIDNVADTRTARELAARAEALTGHNATVVLVQEEPDSGLEPLPPLFGENDEQGDGGAAAGQAERVTYAVQIASTRVHSEAERYVETLRRKGYDPVIVDVEDAMGGWYSVRMGRYESLDEAEQASRKFSKAEGFASLVVEEAE
ncbi:DUF3859 domain-containing protein [Oceanidesulfovibrio marinus]|uniref:SPOR domain-containing protein n=1 Tax=Oceanidesulfovibrio marinus TaxID=370038 RepID=A0A6P1ZL11_9BACT|nr:DUF3859 domain-containing protein [Oceanidesulfovibrio marinus]TVM36473.1 hypothetical protein DQK91_00675 [Oceanidesulfovibrio marinus]